ncbi:MAG: MFS transporter [Jatrophihabitans sp.]|uniref:MFS transporter n=1 Tax=Jatrophihabitans sp. TaxID=1932789 RepID=UPI00390DE6D5
MTKLALGGGAALMNATMAVSSATATLVVGDRLDVAWAALPATAGILGTGLGSVFVAARIARGGYRRGLRAGYLVAVLGSALCVAATCQDRSAEMVVLGLAAGLFLLGMGNAAAQLSRYVAAELQTPARRAAAISFVVWIATTGAVGGPLLLDPSGRGASTCGLPFDCGPFVLAGGCVVLALVSTLAVPGGRRAADVTEAAHRPFDRPSARQALLVMAAAQVIMVAVMTATPMNMLLHGSATSAIGAVLSAHTFGMFAFSPLTGFVVSRFGAYRVIRVGLVVLVVSSAATTFSSGAGQAVSLFLLGYGWNLCFIAGSTLVAGDLDVTDRLAVEGRVDATVWAFAAGAGLLSTILLSLGGAGLIAGFAALVAVAPYAASKAGSTESVNDATVRTPMLGER